VFIFFFALAKKKVGKEGRNRRQNTSALHLELLLLVWNLIHHHQHAVSVKEEEESSATISETVLLA
jgi:hypothetical protein